MPVKRFFKNSFYIIWGYCVLCIFIWIFSEIRGSWVEWDGYNPQLHNQTIQFNQPMIYLETNLAQRYSVRKFDFKYLLETKKDSRFLRIHQPNSPQIQIKKNMKFTLTKTFRFRSEWFEDDNENKYERRLAILLDEENREVVLNSFVLFEQSNRPELAKLEFWGKNL